MGLEGFVGALVTSLVFELLFSVVFFFLLPNSLALVYPSLGYWDKLILPAEFHKHPLHHPDPGLQVKLYEMEQNSHFCCTFV